ncbi:MAG: hypothetical protein R2834_03000 [Rhodothermales bacterium]
MNLLRINDQIVNVDLIQSVNIRGNELTLYVTGREMLFRGEEAMVLRHWLLNNARDLSAHPMTQALEPVVSPASYASGDGATSGVNLFKMPLP